MDEPFQSMPGGEGGGIGGTNGHPPAPAPSEIPLTSIASAPDPFSGSTTPVSVSKPAPDASTDDPVAAAAAASQSWRSMSVSARPDPTGILYVIAVVFVIPLALTLLWVLLPLDVDISIPERDEGLTCNGWMIALFFWIYFTLSQAWFVFYNHRVVGVWDNVQSMYIIVAGAAIHGFLMLILRFSKRLDAILVMTTVFTVSCSFMAIAHSAYLVTQKYDANQIESAVMRSAKLSTCVANAIGMLVMSSAWATLQFMSQQFNSNVSFGEQLGVVIAFPVAFFVLQQLLDFKDGLSDPAAKWEVRYFWQFGLTMLYYMYYRNLFLSVTTWGDFFLFSALPLITEFSALIQLAGWYINCRNSAGNALSRWVCCDVCRGPLSLLGVKDLSGHVRKVSTGVWLKESVRMYSTLAQLIFFPIVRSYRNESYYPVFKALDDSVYDRFILQLFVMLLLDFATCVVLFYTLKRAYNISMFRVGADVLFDRSFVLSIGLLAIHVTNDPFFSLFQCNTFKTEEAYAP